MTEDINLITTEEKKHLQTVGILRIVNLVIFLLILGTFGVWYYLNDQTDKLRTIDSEESWMLNSLQQEVLGYQEEENLIRNLNFHYQKISEFYADYIDYGVLLENILLRRSLFPGLRISNINFDHSNKIVVIRVSSTASEFKEFANLMKNPEEDMGGKVTKGLFSPSGTPEQVNSATNEYILTLRFNENLVK